MIDAVFATNSDLCRQLLADGPLTPAELTRQYNKAIKHDRLAHLYPETTSPQEIERSLTYHAERHDWFEKIAGKWQVTPRERRLSVGGRQKMYDADGNPTYKPIGAPAPNKPKRRPAKNPPYVPDTTGVVATPKRSKPAQRTTKPGKREGKGMAGAEGLLLADVPEPGRSRRNRRRVRMCVICGSEFMGRADAMTCSERCRKQKTRAAQRAATPAVPDTTVVES